MSLVVLVGCGGSFPASDLQRATATASFDERALTESLERIKGWHRAHNTGVASLLADGATDTSIDTKLSETGCRPTMEMRRLWAWHDGETSDAPFVWYHDFLSLDRAAAEYESLVENPFVRWDPDYLPLFEFEGEWYAGYCGAAGLAASPIVHFFIEDEPRITHVNLTTFLAGAAQALESGAVIWRDGGMHENIYAVAAIHAERNPGYPFPYYVPPLTSGD